MTTTDYHASGALPGSARRAMIDSQLRTSGVNEPWVLSAVARVAREDFIPAEARAHAYIDRALPLADGRLIAPPLVHAKMLAAAEPKGTEKTLIVTSGSGYLEALITPLVGSVDTVDARDVAAGLPNGGYSLILIDGAVAEVPASIEAALGADGRIVTGLAQGCVTRLAIGRKAGEAVAYVALSDISIPVLADLAAPKAWAF